MFLFGASQVELVVKNLSARAGDVRDGGSVPGLGRYPGGEHGNPFQYSCLENPRDRGTWQAIGHRFAKSQTQLKQLSTQHVVVQLLSCVWHFATPWTAAHQTPLFSTISWNLLKFMSIELVMLSNHLILCCPFSFYLPSFPASGSFPMNQLFASGGQSNEASASVSVLPTNIHDWFPLGLTGLISLQSAGLSRFFSSTTFQKHQFFGTQSSLWSNSHISTGLLEKP